jgi:hypothetical protein
MQGSFKKLWRFIGGLDLSCFHNNQWIEEDGFGLGSSS